MAGSWADDSPAWRREDLMWLLLAQGVMARPSNGRSAEDSKNHWPARPGHEPDVHLGDDTIKVAHQAAVGAGWSPKGLEIK